MSEEHPSSPVKLEGKGEGKKDNGTDKIKLIPYRQLTSVNDSENSGSDAERALLCHDSDSGR